METQQRTGSASCRVRRIPRPFGYALLTIPAIAAAGALALPTIASATQSDSQAVSQHVTTPKPTQTVAVAGQQARAGSSAVTHKKVVVAPKADRKVKAKAKGTSKELKAFFKAGYDYDDAVLLSRLWAQGMTPYDAKLFAGDKLVHHLPLPTKPGDTPESVGQEVAWQAYFDNGYGYDDAVKLAKLWNSPVKNGDYGDVKAAAGRKLLGGLDLPIRSGGTATPTTQQSLAAFFKAGYDYDDAVLLSRLWANGITPADAKAAAGDKLLSHVPVPIQPGATPDTVSQDLALEAYFNNGYGYEDAVMLAKLWNSPVKNGDYSDVKTTAGRKLLAGVQVPNVG